MRLITNKWVLKLSLYKLVQHLRDYINLKDKKSPIKIKSRKLKISFTNLILNTNKLKKTCL